MTRDQKRNLIVQGGLVAGAVLLGWLFVADADAESLFVVVRRLEAVA